MFGVVWLMIGLCAIDVRLVGGNAILRNFDAGRPSTAAVANQTTVITWDERPEDSPTASIDDDDDDDDDDDEAHHRGRGLFQMFRRFCKSPPRNIMRTDDWTATSDWPPLPPHPLRTNLWEIQCRWRGQTYHSRRRRSRHCNLDQELHSESRRETRNHHPRLKGDRFSTLILDFDPSGYVRVKPASDDGHLNQNDTWRTMGTWTLEPNGVKCRIPILAFLEEAGSTTSDHIHTAALVTSDKLVDSYHDMAVHEKENVLTMDFHANPFGAQPKFTRGVFYGQRHQSSWPMRLRPVVATFTGRGIGLDTVDLSYRQRQLPPTSGP